MSAKMAMRIDLADDLRRFGSQAMGFREARRLEGQAATTAMLDF
jgi:hypothetical protein